MKIMPLVEIMFNQLQKVEIDASVIHESLNNFEDNILKIRNSEDLHTENNKEDEPPTKRMKEEHSQSELKRQAKEACDVINCQVKERFDFTSLLIARKRFVVEKFITYEITFPEVLRKVCS